MNMIKRCFGKYLPLITLIFFLINIPFSHAQDYSDLYWLFGQSKYNITFKKSDFTAQADSIQNPAFGMGGSAVATDPYSGDLMFYSDGTLVYDQSHQLIAGYTAGLNGNTLGDQPALVTPIPGQNYVYFVIANSASAISAGSIFAARVDMKLQGNAPTTNIPKYGVMQNPFNTQITSNASEGMLVVADPSGSKYWIITHERGTSTFDVTPVTNIGIDNTNSVTFNFSSNGFPSMNVANLSYNPTVKKIAVSPQDTSRNIQILNFSNSTGVLSYDTVVYNSANNDFSSDPNDNYEIYDTEWSPNGTKLYISRHGSDGITGMVYQFDFTKANVSLAPLMPAPVYRSYGLKIGPDNIIYNVYQEIAGGPLLLGRILNADSAASSVIYQQAIFGGTNYNGRQFSETLPFQKPNINNASIDFDGTFFGMSTAFLPKINPPATNYSWDFGDGNTSNEVSPIHKYNAAGSYVVSLTANVGGRDTVVSVPVLIGQCDSLVLKNDKGSTLPTDTTICQDETLLLDASQPPAISYKWSVEGVTTPTYTVDTAGYYWVVGTYNSAAGPCFSYDHINVSEYNYQLQIANQWYFGNQAGIDFNTQPPVALTDGVMNAPEGCAAISDRNGKILFYSDGNIVYGRTGEVLGQNIGGDNSATQSVLSVPFPGDETRYYIFTTKEVYGDNTYMLEYSLFDIKQAASGNSDPGSVIKQGFPLYTKNTERVTAIGGYGQNAVLATHEYGNNTFRFYPITPNGIGAPKLQSIGSVHEFGSSVSSEGYMKFSSDGRKLAVALVSGGNNYVELFDYTDSSLTLSNFQQITFTETYPQYQVYGLEFSPSSNKLFVTLSGNTSRLYEFRLDSANIDFINQTRNLLREENQKFGALQLAPDGQIYVAIDNSPVMATINANPDPASPSTYNPTGMDLQGKTSRLGLPNYVQNMSSGVGAPTASVAGLCVGQPTALNGQGSSSIDSYQWIITKKGDSTRVFSSTNMQDTVTLQTAGDYTVSFRVYNRCGLDTAIIQNITIQDPPPSPTIPDALSICTGNEILEALPAGTSGYTYLWNDGSTGRTHGVSTPGIYSVTISYLNPSLNGCTSDSSTFVADGRPQYDLGPDLSLCLNSTAQPLRTNLTPVSYNFNWSINGSSSAADTLTSHAVSTATLGNFKYTVNVRDKLTTCARKDSVIITVGDIPNAAFAVTSSTCGLSNGSIQVSGLPKNALAYLYDQNGAQTGLTNLAAGSYTLIIQDQINGCTKSFNAVLNDSTQMTISAIPKPDCSFGTIDVTLNNVTLPVNYTLSGTDNSQVFNGADNVLSFTINAVQPGTFNLQITETRSNGCTKTEPGIILTKPPTAGLDIQQDYTNCQASLIINPDPNGQFPDQTYTWNGPGVPTTDFQTSTLLTTRGGAFTVKAHYTKDPSVCDTVGTFTINLYEAPIVNITQNGTGCGGPVQLSADITNIKPGQTFSFLWSNGQTSQSVNFPSPSGTDSVAYINNSVTVANQQTGCQGNAGPLDVSTYTPYSVFLTSSIACDDGKPVTITANILNINTNNIQSYKWSGPDDSIAVFDTRIIKVDPAGNYSVTTQWGPCEESASLKLIRSPVTQPDIDPYYAICTADPANETVIITPGNFVSYSILDLDNNQTLSEIQPGTYEITEAALYEGTGINGFGCASIDTFQVDVKCIPTLYAPNAFYPAATIEKNRTFSVDGLYLADDFQIIIYNRWGEVVYQSKAKDFKWDGTSKDGKPLPVGTYAYIIEYRSITDTSSNAPFEVKRGGVMILR